MNDITPTEAVRQVCAICGKGGYLFKCSKPCQAKDWPIHKILCKFIVAKNNGETADYECVVDRPEDTVLGVNSLVGAVWIYLTEDTPFSGYAGASFLNDGADPLHIEIAHIVAVVEYLQRECTELTGTHAREAGGEKVDREGLVKRLLTPAAFKKWCGGALHDMMTGKGRARGFEDYLECPPLDDGTTTSAKRDKKGKITKGKAKSMA
ncbi:hypothetical protein LTR27_006907 [Elasticomyces elasticus]|nr:hypothetical protein LTR27_006907 [Elasticomyces elasticus]